MDTSKLHALRNGRFFQNWDEFVTNERVASSERSLQLLCDQRLSCGEALTESKARNLVNECVDRFNDLDDGWICTIEREDIYDQIGSAIDCCGFTFDEDWTDGRDW